MRELQEVLRVNPDGVCRICTEIFCAAGYPRENAEFIANSLVFADIRGVSSHGVARIKSYMERAQKEHWNADPQITYQQKGAICIVDGDDGFGSIVGTRAMKKAIEIAKEHGIGFCSVRRSAHYGMASYYPMLAAQEGMIGFSCTNGVANLAHFGSREGMLGTNPFSMAVPMKDEEPMVLDVACSVTARGNISNCKREGKDIPLGWAVDADGNPTTDAAKALVGAVLPFAGHKGSGIAIMVDVLCGILNQGVTSKHVREDKTTGPQVGHTMIAIDISAFEDPAEFDARIKKFACELREANKAPNVDKIYVPGELEAERAAYNRTHGIKMGRGAFTELCEACADYGVTIDPYQYIMEG
ncbi:MAG: Ldh family oxidoreductase [Clostridia bacterium]|nr:Ldh family oxidoreductase [Clostridia bacterium]